MVGRLLRPRVRRSLDLATRGLAVQLGKIPFASHQRGDAEGVEGRFELEIADPDALWSLEPGEPAPRRWVMHAGPDGLRIRAGACLDADARVRMTAARCAGLVAGRRPRPEGSTSPARPTGLPRCWTCSRRRRGRSRPPPDAGSAPSTIGARPGRQTGEARRP